MSWKWTPQKEQAAFLVWEGLLTRQQIADECGIALCTLKDWLGEQPFRERVEEIHRQYRDHLLTSGIPFVRRESRVAALSQLASDALAEWSERRWLSEMRPTGQGMIVNERLNRDAADIFRGALADVAKELGERSTSSKVELNARIEHAPLQVTSVELPPELVAKYLRGGDQIIDADASDDETDERDSATPLFQIKTRE